MSVRNKNLTSAQGMPKNAQVQTCIHITVLIVLNMLRQIVTFLMGGHIVNVITFAYQTNIVI